MKIKNVVSLFLGFSTMGMILTNGEKIEAATITYDITVDNFDGSLSGETFTGSFSFDDSSLTGTGSEFVSVFDLSFDFLGVTYTEADDISLSGAGAEFDNGNFLGLSYSTNVEFSFVPGFFSVDESFFAYDFGQGDNGSGEVTYTLNNSTPVPEPATILGLFLGTLLPVSVSSLLKNKASIN